jgi:hypothetical protein
MNSTNPEVDLFIAGIAIIVGLVAMILAVVIYWRIFAKTGNNGALSLLMFVPLVNLFMLLYLAFSEWPIEREVQQLRSQSGYGGGYR